ncbi:MAG: nucleotidyltransferase domain-containing protein [Nanoarchaeota archaeon]
MKNKINSTYANSVAKLVTDLKKIKAVRTIILFGSYSRMKQKPLSDIDICILVDKKIPLKIKSEIYSYASKKIDISLFWDLPPQIRYDVLKDGKILFNRNKDYLHSATIETMSEYLDFRHIIDRNIMRVFSV